MVAFPDLLVDLHPDRIPLLGLGNLLVLDLQGSDDLLKIGLAADDPDRVADLENRGKVEHGHAGFVEIMADVTDQFTFGFLAMTAAHSI